MSACVTRRMAKMLIIPDGRTLLEDMNHPLIAAMRELYDNAGNQQDVSERDSEGQSDTADQVCIVYGEPTPAHVDIRQTQDG